jgi:hypothetical protein
MSVARLGLLACVVTLGATVSAEAATYCVPGPNSDGLSVSDVTFRASAADNCYGVVDGNDTESAIESVWGGGFDAVLKSDGANSTSYLGFDWTLTATGTTSGTWTLGVTDPTLPSSFPVAVDLVVVLKAGDAYATYFFDNEVFNTAGSGNGTFEINFLNNGGQVPALSHMSVYLRESDPPTRVPEPGISLLLGAGIGAVALKARRREGDNA